MEVNVDMLEQVDLTDLSDQDTVDVFLSCGAEDNNIASPLPGMYSLRIYAPLPASCLLTATAQLSRSIQSLL